jgi:hypothetical protein
MNSAPEQQLVDVDVAETGDDALVEQQRLDRRLAAGQRAGQLVRFHFERVRTHLERRGDAGGIAHEEVAEAARIDVTQLAAAREVNARVGVGFNAGATLSTSELVTDTSSEPSAEGQSGIVPTLVPASSTGSKSRAQGVRLAGPSDLVR